MLKNFNSIEEKVAFYESISFEAFSNCITLEEVYKKYDIEESQRLTLYQIQLMELQATVGSHGVLIG